jgi:hypothetical protein
MRAGDRGSSQPISLCPKLKYMYRNRSVDVSHGSDIVIPNTQPNSDQRFGLVLEVHLLLASSAIRASEVGRHRSEMTPSAARSATATTERPTPHSSPRWMTAARFDGAAQVTSYLGGVPRELSSGENQHRGQILRIRTCSRS